MSNVQIIHSDCLEYMATLKDKEYELAVVDPEYGIDAGNMTMGKGVSSTIKKSNWDKRPVSEKYWKELFRVTQNQIVFGGNYFNLPIRNSWIVWDKDRQKEVSFSDGELIWTSFNFNLKIHKHKYDGFLGADKDCRIHKCQKPVALYQWLLKNYAKQGDRILDTHGGSMSSVIACINMGFSITALEIDKDYFEAGCDRIKRHLAQEDFTRPSIEMKIGGTMYV